jgi:NAD(P)-dependent dehydrogenase (short-subunit alcohol dehydrogenase family)
MQVTAPAARRVVFITGAGRGIGRATALLCLRRGAAVAAVDRDPAGLVTLAAEAGVGSAGAGLDATALDSALWTHALDVTDAPAARAVVDAAAAHFGRLDVLINNAGVLSHGPFATMDEAAVARMIAVNIGGVVAVSRAALPHLEATGGVLVSLSSAAAIYGAPELAIYSATKAFVRSFTEALELELAGRVRVVDVMPGYVDTDMVRVEQEQSRIVKRLGIKLSPDDVAAAIWDAAHKDGPTHRILQLDIRLQRLAAGISPRLGRMILRLASR